MLIGEFQVNLAAKNRISLPRKLLSELNNQVVITRGYEKSIILVDSERWRTLVSEINRRPLLNMSVRDTKRFLLGGAFELELDSQGRFVLPEALRDYAQIDQEISILGVGEWIELWSAERWSIKLDYLSKNSADIADRLSDFND